MSKSAASVIATRAIRKTGQGGQRGPLELPHPSEPVRTVRWTGEAFDLDNKAVRVLAYDVSPSGWTDELTQLHEETGGSHHFIDVASRAHALSETLRCVPGETATVLEIGCSSGFMLRDLMAGLPGRRIVGADYTRGTLEALGRRMRGIPLIQFDLTRCPLPDEFADVAILLNVLEHIGDHEAAVAELYRIVKPGGTVIIEVPAGSSLFDIYDRVLMHFRRYDMPFLVSLLGAAGFSIERRSHLGALLYPAFWLSKRINQMRYPAGGVIDEEPVIARMISATRRTSRFMHAVMRLEALLRKFVYFPRGIRCVVTCRKAGPLVICSASQFDVL